jgi:hypothetical protein
MTQRQYIQIVENEIASLNARIDQKILSGLGYDSEARRHKRLLGLTRQMKRKGFMEKIFGGVNRSYVR